MTNEQKAAYVNTMTACALAEIAGMRAEDERRTVSGLPPIYGEQEFSAVPDRYGIHHNAVLSLFHGG